MDGASRDALQIEAATRDDLAALHAIYDRYVVETPVTFDVLPRSPAERETWFAQFGSGGRHRLLVGRIGRDLAGFACSNEFRHKAAYETSVETTIYLAAQHCGRGHGRRLYEALFDVLAGEDVHRAYAGITLPNDASVALHETLGFHVVGTFEQVGRKFGRYWSVRWFEKELA